MTGNGREPAVWVRGLAKRFDEIEAVNGIDFEVEPGDHDRDALHARAPHRR